jgi:alpha-1,2-mannosyltransferase
LIGVLPAYGLLLGHLAAVGCGIAGIKAWSDNRRPGSLIPIALATWCIILAVVTFIVIDPQYPFWDFRAAYYPAGKAVVDDPATLGGLMGKGINGFVNLPIVAYLFAPLSMLPLRYSIGLFTLCGLGASLAAWLLLVRLAALKGVDRWLLLLLFAANGPLLYSIKEGNTSQFVLTALAGSLCLLRARRSVAAGVLLGMAAVLKLPLLLFGVYFVLRRDWRGTFAFAGVCIAMGTASVAVFGWDFHVRWFELCVRQFSNQWIAAFNVQSLQSFVLRWQASPALLHDWTAYPPTSSQRIGCYVLVGVLYLAAIWGWVRGAVRGRNTDLSFLLVLCLAVASSPLSWSHYYTWLLLPAALHLGSRSPFARERVPRLIGWTAIILATLLVRSLDIANSDLMSVYSEFGVSMLLFSGLLWIGLIVWSLARTAVAESPAVLPAAPRGQALAWIPGNRGVVG